MSKNIVEKKNNKMAFIKKDLDDTIDRIKKSIDEVKPINDAFKKKFNVL